MKIVLLYIWGTKDSNMLLQGWAFDKLQIQDGQLISRRTMKFIEKNIDRLKHSRINVNVPQRQEGVGRRSVLLNSAHPTLLCIFIIRVGGKKEKMPSIFVALMWPDGIPFPNQNLL